MLKIWKLFKSYNNDTYTLNNISFKTGNIGLLFIVGESGSGKTTLLNILGSLDKGDSGNVYFNNEDIQDYSIKEKEYYRSKEIGFIFQEYNLFNHINVRDNILLSEAILGEINKTFKYKQILQLLDISNLEYRFPNELSTGQKQRVAIARALMKSPHLILADEPTGSLDHENATAILEYLKEISKSTLVIIVTHNMEFATKYGDRIIRLDQGIIIEDTTLAHNSETESDIINEKAYHAKSLSFRMFFKYVWSNIKAKKISTSILIILLSMIITILATLTFIKNYDITRFTLENMKLNKENTVSIMYNKYLYDSNRESYINTMSGQKQENLDELSKLFPNHKFKSVYKTDFHLRIEDDNNFVNKQVNGFMELDENTLHDYNFKLVAGKLPKKNRDCIEIAISKYLYETIYTKNLKFNDKDIFIDSYKSIINQKLLQKNRSYKIVGIIDTNFNYNSDIIVKNTKEYDVHNAAFTYKGYANDFYSQNKDTFEVFNENKDYFSAYHNRGNTLFTVINKLNNQNVIFRENFSFNNLNKDDVVISLAEFINLFETDRDISNLIINQVHIFAKENYSIIKDVFEEDFGVSSYYDYYTYILNNNNNKYQIDYDYKYFREKTIENLISNHVNYEMSLSVEKASLIFTKKLNVVGVIDEHATSGNLYVSESLYDKLYDYNDGNIAFVTTVIHFNNDDVQLMDYIYVHEGNYTLGNSSRYPIDIVNADYALLSIFYFYIWIILISFAFFIIYYISHSILKNEKRNIGLLAALGVKKKDIFKLIISEHVFTLILSLTIGLISSFVLTSKVNSYIKIKYFVDANVAIYHPIVIILISLVIFLFTVIIYLISIYKYSKISPYRIIKNND